MLNHLILEEGCLYYRQRRGVQWHIVQLTQGKPSKTWNFEVPNCWEPVQCQP